MCMRMDSMCLCVTVPRTYADDIDRLGPIASNLVTGKRQRAYGNSENRRRSEEKWYFAVPIVAPRLQSSAVIPTAGSRLFHSKSVSQSPPLRRHLGCGTARVGTLDKRGGWGRGA